MYDIAIIDADGAASRVRRLGKAVAREGAVINRPASLNQIYAGAGGVALLGEAAG